MSDIKVAVFVDGADALHKLRCGEPVSGRLFKRGMSEVELHVPLKDLVLKMGLSEVVILNHKVSQSWES